MSEKAIIDDTLYFLFILTIEYIEKGKISEESKDKYQKYTEELRLLGYTCNAFKRPDNYNISNEQYYGFKIEEIMLNSNIIKYEENFTESEIKEYLRNMNIDNLLDE